jgi:AAA+ superfamily predicted ATPase
MTSLDELLPDPMRPDSGVLAGLSRWELNPVSAAAVLAKDLPDQRFMLWSCGNEQHATALRLFVGNGNTREGSVGETWRWSRQKMSMPDVTLWSGDTKEMKLAMGWLGLLKITNVLLKKSFYLFGYLRANSMEQLNTEYLVTADADLSLLLDFADSAVRELIKKRRRSQSAHVSVQGGMDFDLDTRQKEKIYLPDGQLNEIISTCENFFNSQPLYKRLGIPWRLGLLLIGSTGVGKTSICRYLAKHLYLKFRTVINQLSINAGTDSDDLRTFFFRDWQERRRLLILEDVESIATESKCSRSEFLNMLDGMCVSKQGYVLLATSNHPDQIDSALVNRPSRFDRLVRIELPNATLRLKYLNDLYPAMDKGVLDKIVQRSKHWSFAWLKECHVTAAILAVKRGLPAVTPDILLEAFNLLSKQFNTAKQIKTDKEQPSDTLGFAAATSDEEEIESLAS